MFKMAAAAGGSSKTTNLDDKKFAAALKAARLVRTALRLHSVHGLGNVDSLRMRVGAVSPYSFLGLGARSFCGAGAAAVVSVGALGRAVASLRAHNASEPYFLYLPWQVSVLAAAAFVSNGYV